jgi:CubicO group peptidase (beta-lactamase class C family)
MLASDSGSLILEDLVENYIPEVTGSDVKNLRIQDLLQDLSSRGGSDSTPGGMRERLLREIVARATGIPFEAFLAGRLFEPLGMKNAFFNPPSTHDTGMAFPTSSENPRLFCSAHDLAIFAQMILNRGMYDHRRLFKSDTIARFTAARGPWSKPSDAGLSGRFFSPSAFGHSCSGGSFLWLDPAKKLFVVFLANGSPQDERIPEAQRQIAESVAAAIPR